MIGYFVVFFFFFLLYSLVNLILLSDSILKMHRIIRKMLILRSLVNIARVHLLSVVTVYAHLSFFFLFPQCITCSGR